MSSVVVVPYDSQWPARFIELKNRLWPLIKDFAVSIEHVGSTSVPGLAAKPVIDIDIVIPDPTFLARAVEALSKAGYEHRGNLGIADREAFRDLNPPFKNNLYVCPRESVALKNHLALRDSLRADDRLRDDYSKLKFALAAKYPDSIDDYIEGKTDFILGILRKNGLSSDRLEEIRDANRAPSRPPEATPFGIPTFETERLFLRVPTLLDAPSYEKHFSDYEVVRYLSHLVPWPYPEGGVAQFLQTIVYPQLGKNRWMWGIFEKENPDEMIGGVELWRNDSPDNRGFWLARRFWGRGYMKEATARINDYAFEELGFEKLIFSNAVENDRSRGVKQKAGARYLRTDSFKFVDPSVTEREFWELTKENWRKFRDGKV